MSWLSIVLVIVQLLGPILAELFRRWLEVAAARMPNPANPTPADMNKFWDEVLKQIPWYRMAARGLVGVARKVTIARCQEIVNAAQVGAAVAPLTSDEVKAFSAQL